METGRVVFTAPGRVELQRVEVAAPGPGQVLIENAATAVSPGTERAVLLQLPNAVRRFPYIPGYSSAGTVLAVGPGVTAPSPGDAVVADAPHEGHSIRPARAVVPVPAGLDLDRAAFAYMGAIALQGIRKARLELGETVLVLGLGLVGQLAAQLARCAGAARVSALDRHPGRLAVAERCGIRAHPLGADGEAAVAAAGRDAPDRGFDVVVDATGFPEAAALALSAAAVRGRVVLLGSTRGLSTLNLYEYVHRRGVLVIGAHNMVRPREESSAGYWTVRRDMECVLELLLQGRLDLGPLVSDRIAPAEAPALYARLADWDPALLAAVIDWSAPRPAPSG